MALIFKSLAGLLTVDRGVMMIDMSIVVVLFAILLIAASAEAFSEAPRDMRDAMCFLVMLIVGVAIVLVFVVKDL
jgi:hypothetical protein